MAKTQHYSKEDQDEQIAAAVVDAPAPTLNMTPLAVTNPALPDRTNLYKAVIETNQSDMQEELEVAAPDARKAQAAIVSSAGEEENIFIVSFNLLGRNIPQVSIPEAAIWWTEGDGVIRNT
jgi:hypothetical protein